MIVDTTKVLLQNLTTSFYLTIKFWVITYRKVNSYMQSFKKSLPKLGNKLRSLIKDYIFRMTIIAINMVNEKFSYYFINNFF